MKINPWLSLVFDKNRQSFILKEEQSIIAKFNTKVSDQYKIHCSIFPAPFMGNVHTAPVIVLGLNPGYDEKEEERGYYIKYKSWWMQQIQHKLPCPELPLFCLEKEYVEQSPYWDQKLHSLIDLLGREKVAANIAKVQFFPYHSKKFKPLYKRLLKEEGFSSQYLLSQEYNFNLVRKGIERNASIIIPRSKRYWFQAIPELVEYPDLHFTNSYGNIIMSENNLGPKSFNDILNKINQNKF